MQGEDVSSRSCAIGEQVASCLGPFLSSLTLSPLHILPSTGVALRTRTEVFGLTSQFCHSIWTVAGWEWAWDLKLVPVEGLCRAGHGASFLASHWVVRKSIQRRHDISIKVTQCGEEGEDLEVLVLLQKSTVATVCICVPANSHPRPGPLS